MSLRALAAFLPAWVIGTALVVLLWPRGRERSWLLACVLGGGLGLGATSLVFFAWGILGGEDTRVYFGLEGVMALGLAGAAGFRLHQQRIRLEPGSRGPWIVSLAVALGLAVLLAVHYRYALVWPQGSYDGVVIWNMRARFLYLSEGDWGPAFSPLLNWKIHPDYPLLLPMTVARLWSAAGSLNPPISIYAALVFGMGLMALLYAVLTWRLSGGSGALGLLLLAAAAQFKLSLAGQTADLPLAFFFLAACILVDHGIKEERGGFLALGGLAAGLAAWTKNEGQLFVLVCLGVMAVALRRKPRLVAAWFSGALPALAAVMFFKLHLAPVTDLFQGQSAANYLERLLDGERYVLIAREAGRAWLFSSAPLVLLAGLWLVAREPERWPVLTPAAALWGLTWLGYIGIYLITPHDLAWHLSTSVDRLALQWLPVALYLALSSLPPAEQIVVRGLRSAEPR